MIANDRFDTITVKEVGGRWAVCDANDVTLYEYTTETATHKAEQVREWGRQGARDGDGVVGATGGWGSRPLRWYHPPRESSSSRSLEWFRRPSRLLPGPPRLVTDEHDGNSDEAGCG